jgi:hypothetical protein
LAAVTPRSRAAGLMLAVAEACRVEAVANKEADSQRTQDAAIFNSAVARVAM